MRGPQRNHLHHGHGAYEGAARKDFFRAAPLCVSVRSAQRSTTASTSREDRIWNSWPSYLTSVPP